MKIIYLTPLLPYPDDDGAKAIALSNLKALIKLGVKVTLFTFIENKKDYKYKKNLLGLGIKEVYAIYNPKISESNKITLTIRFLKSLFSYKTFQMTKYWDFNLVSEIKKYLSKNKTDAIWINYALMCQYYPGYFKGRKIFSNLCIDSLIHKQIFLNSNFIQIKLNSLFDWIKYSLLEKWLYQKFDLIFQVSQNDKSYLKNKLGQKNTFYLPISVPILNIKQKKRKKNIILFIGKLPWAPNRDGFSWFLKDIFPKLKKQIPDIKLWVLGKLSSSYKNKINSFDGVTFLGHKINMSKIIDIASVSINPVRYGTGIKMKLFTAMSYGIPVITMPEGLNGMPVKNNIEMLIAENENDFLNKIVYSLKYPDKISHLPKNAHRYLIKNHSPQITENILQKELKTLFPKF